MVRKRKSKQKGSVKWNGAAWVMRYRVRSGDGWSERKEVLSGLKAGEGDDADQLLRERMKRINKENDPQGPGPKPHPLEIDFATFISSQWRNYLEAKGRKVSTLDSYQAMLDSIVLPAIGKRRLKDITRLDIAALLTGLSGAGKSPGYVLTVYAFLRGIFSLAQDLEFIKKSPVKRKLHRPEFEPAEKPTLTLDQIRKVEAGFPVELRALCVCVAVTGLRIGELLALRWCDVDLEARTLTVAHNFYRGHLLKPKTRKSNRTVRMSRTLTARLSEHRAGSQWAGPDDFVFARADGSPNNPDALRRDVLYPAMDAAGIKRVKGQYGFHIFRHTVVSILRAQAVDVTVAQNLLGHSNISTTVDIYSHAESKIAGGAETLDEAIWPDNSPVLSEGSDRIQ
jgi:integrase